MVSLGNGWDSLLADEFEKDYYLQLRKFLKMEYSSRRIFPDMYDIFNALRYTAPENVKVVILGQDPYHGMGQAHGLCFSVKRGVKPPPSLQNIFKEIQDELHIAPPTHGELTSWAKQGVLLLNTVLTVVESMPNSHKGRGWERFTDRVISHVNSFDRPIVYLLWGANARSKKALITNPRHLVLESPHPSPLSACSGFFGNGHFASANRFLGQNGLAPIDWSLPN